MMRRRGASWVVVYISRSTKLQPRLLTQADKRLNLSLLLAKQQSTSMEPILKSSGQETQQGSPIARPWKIAFSCDIFEADVGGFFSEKQKYGYRGFGDNDGKCVKYDFDQADDVPGAIRAGRAVGIIGAVVGAIVFLLSIYTPFFYIPKGIFQALGISFGAIMIVLNFITFFLGLIDCGPFPDSPDCDTAVQRPAVSIVAWVIWIFLVVAFACLRGPRKVAATTITPSPAEVVLPEEVDAPPEEEADDFDL
eukprot:scaffold6164_cov163-Amphora_coffeaeformis.AAC.22